MALGIEERRALAAGKLGTQPVSPTGQPTYGLQFGQPTSNLQYAPGKYAAVTQDQSKFFGFYSAVFAGLPPEFILELSRQQSLMPANKYLDAGQVSVIASNYGISAVEINRRIQGGGQGGGGGGATKAQQIASLAAIINDTARQLGIAFSPEQITNLASTAQAQNFNSAQIIDALTKDLSFYQLQAGTLKTSYEQFQTIGKQFLVNLSDASAKNWAIAVAKGEMTEDTVVQNIREAAKIANPWLAKYIDQGLNPIDVLTPNRDFIAAGLEIDPNTLDLMDQKVIKMMTTGTGPDRQLANQSQLTANIRNDSRWRKTSNARELTSGMAGMISSIFGRSAF